LIANEYRPETYLFNLYLNNKVDNDRIFSINIENNEFNEIKLNNFPERVPFHPHSMSLYITPEKNYILYILNHAVNYNYEGQERIEKFILRFESKKISLTYIDTIILPDEFFLRIESISAINEDLFYFTTNTQYENPKDSDELLGIQSYINYLKNKLLKIINPMLNIKQCFLYLYDKENKENEISIVENSQSTIYAGITFDNKRNLLYAIKPTEKKMSVFEINKKETKLIKTIPILYVGNNIFYDSKDDKIYIGINGKKSEEESIINKLRDNKNLENVVSFSGYEIINPEDDFSISDIMIMKNDSFKWINSAVENKGKIYMSSIYSKGIFISEKK
jgi:predicted metalloprotease